MLIFTVHLVCMYHLTNYHAHNSGMMHARAASAEYLDLVESCTYLIAIHVMAVTTPRQWSCGNPFALLCLLLHQPVHCIPATSKHGPEQILPLSE